MVATLAGKGILIRQSYLDIPKHRNRSIILTKFTNSKNTLETKSFSPLVLQETEPETPQTTTSSNKVISDAAVSRNASIYSKTRDFQCAFVF